MTRPAAPDAGRVIAGSARSTRLDGPGPGTRPMGDRVKQTLFAILDPYLPGARVLDLFAGSGAAGIEALSRGALEATFVERERAAVDVIVANLQRTHLRERGRVFRADALDHLRQRAAGEPAWDIVLLDPPYDQPTLVSAALVSLAGHLAAHAWVVAKHARRNAPPAQVGLLASVRERRFGESTLTFYRRRAAAADESDSREGQAAT